MKMNITLNTKEIKLVYDPKKSQITSPNSMQ